MASQDMPPPGGFASINVERTYPKPILRQGILFTVLFGLTLWAPNYISELKKRDRILRVEQMEHYIAAEPFMAAERERKFLRHLRVIREEERELMKDHPNWKLGTLYGERVFKTLPKDSLPPIHIAEYAALRPKDEQIFHINLPDFHQ